MDTRLTHINKMYVPHKRKYGQKYGRTSNGRTKSGTKISFSLPYVNNGKLFFSQYAWPFLMLLADKSVPSGNNSTLPTSPYEPAKIQTFSTTHDVANGRVAFWSSMVCDTVCGDTGWLTTCVCVCLCVCAYSGAVLRTVCAFV